MELIGQNHLPPLRQLRLGVGRAVQQPIQAAEPFGVQVQKFAFPVVPLVFCLGGIGAAVELQVQLALPHRQVRVPVNPPGQPVEKFAGKADPGVRCAGDPMGEPARQLQMLGRRAAAPVSVSEGQQHLGAQVLLLVTVPGSGNHRRGCMRHIGGAPGGLLPAFFVLRRQEIGANRGPVNALPQKGVIGHPVLVVPADLRGDKPFHAALAQNLRQRRGIAKDIRQPENPVLHPELPAEKTLAINHLAHQAFAAGQIAVGLHPHAPLTFPAPLADALPDLLIQCGGFLPQVLIQKGLGGHKAVFRIAPHQLQHRGKAALHLLPGLAEGPQPGAVDVRVPDALHGDGRGAAEAPVKFPVHPVRRARDRSEKFRRAQRIQIQQIHRSRQPFQNGGVRPAVGLQVSQALKRHPDVIPQLFHLGPEIADGGIQPRTLHPRADIAVQIHLVMGFPLQRQLRVVGVHSLPQHTVHIHQKLRVVGVPAAALGADLQQHRGVPHLLRNFHREVKPRMAVRAAAPERVCFKRHKRLRRGRGVAFLIAAGALPDTLQRADMIISLRFQQLQILPDFPISTVAHCFPNPFIGFRPGAGPA